MSALAYRTLEKIRIGRPVDRLAFISEKCRGKRVLDLGCFDETALVKRGTEHWLHGRISAVARQVTGVDSSSQIPAGGVETGTNSRVFKGDASDPAVIGARGAEAEVVVAGEFIEHLESPLKFLRDLRQALPGRELIISTPNGGCASNCLLGLIGREAQHHDHLQNFTYKTLNTLFLRAGFEQWEIVPYRLYATEMKLHARGAMRPAISMVEYAIRAIEYLFPLLSFGYIVRARL
jgi:SAM-dependent methyltransferase